jgi:hypothetical protein
VNPQPKPVKRPKKPRKPLKRTRMRRGPPKRLSRPGSDPGRLEFCRSLPCAAAPFMHCQGAIEASHDRSHTGLGLKATDRETVPKCGWHHKAWEAHRGPFFGWSNETRHEWMADRIAEVNEKWDALPVYKRAAWREIADERRAERAAALRGGA